MVVITRSLIVMHVQVAIITTIQFNHVIYHSYQIHINFTDLVINHKLNHCSHT